MEKMFDPEFQKLSDQKFVIADQVYNKLNEEIYQFRQDVRDILDEVSPIKNEIIRQINKIIAKSLPQVAVEVYGSHATQLCLHWSDIDLVVIPPPENNHRMYNQNHSHSSIYNGRHLLLEQVYEELRRDEHKSWISKVQFIENTTVPVIKLECSIFPISP
jgi:DNA polymerase sigma